MPEFRQNAPKELDESNSRANRAAAGARAAAPAGAVRHRARRRRLPRTCCGWAGYSAATWYRFGDAPGAAKPDPLLDALMPQVDVDERHEIVVDAPADVTFAAARDLELDRSPVIRLIFAARTLPSTLGGETGPTRHPVGIVDETLALGWGILAETPGRVIAVGAVTKPWEPVVTFHALPPQEFPRFSQPGFAKIVWTLEAEPLGPSRSIARTETRVITTDPASRRLFRRYWALFSPGILLIRYEGLRLVKADAERRAAR